MKDVPIADLLSRAGLRDSNADLGLAALRDAGLTRAGKMNIAENKIKAAQNTLRDAFFRACHKQACREIRGPHVITCPRRGIAALAQAVLWHVNGRA